MVKSMTGYGRAREMRSGRDITVEVRSVNNRYLDCTVKLPRAYILRRTPSRHAYRRRSPAARWMCSSPSTPLRRMWRWCR